MVILAAVLGAAGAGLAVGLKPSASAETFVGRSTGSYKATETYYKQFGQEPIEVLVRGNLQKLLLSSDIERLAGLEGCISGRVPRRALAVEGGVNGPCGQLARTHAVKLVVGPGTFINETAQLIDTELKQREAAAKKEAAEAKHFVSSEALKRGKTEAEADELGEEAREASLRIFSAEVAALGFRYGLSKPPTFDEPKFVETVVFDSTAEKPGTPKQRFAYLFPSRDAALISVRLRGGLSPAQVEAALAAIHRAVAMPQWQLRYGSYLITGEPVIVSELSSSITHSILLLLVAAALVMALVLSLVFRGRPRLLPLLIALLAAALTFGVLALSGAGLSIGEVAVLPVLIGLAVDYAIQLHSRVAEAEAAGALDLREAVVSAAKSGGPSIAAAAAASACAMLVLELSPVPTVRSFATLLVVGLALALLCAVTVGSAVIVLFGTRASGRGGVAASPAKRVWGERLAKRVRGEGFAKRVPGVEAVRSAWRGAEELVQNNALTRLVSRVALDGARRWPQRALGVGVLLAAIGFGLAGQVAVQTDVTKLVPQDMTSLRNLKTLEKLSGVGGEIDLMLSGKNLGKPATIEWMSGYQNEMLKRFGYSESRGCGHARLCPAFSLPDLFDGFKEGERSGSTQLGATEVSGLLSLLPSYFSQDVITPSRRYASLAFGVRLMPLSAQQQMIETMRSSLRPPPGVHAQLVGLPVLAAQASAEVGSTSRRIIDLLAGLAIVALVLLIAFRGDLRRALVPLLPVTLASGWSSLLVFLLGIPLNPMSVTLSALTIAISTEFSVLLCERYRSERGSGHPPERALSRTWGGTGAAVAASGVTAIAGFGVLTLSDIAMLRDFGFVTLIDLAVALLGVMLLLPGILLMAEDGRLRRLPGDAVRGLPGLLRDVLGRLRKLPGALRGLPGLLRDGIGGRPRRRRRARHGASA
jgi:hypothetical protein